MSTSIGFHKSSVAYFSNGDRRFNQPFAPTSGYAHAFVQGDVIGVGYRPRTGSIFFTRNGRRLDEAVFGQKSQNFFPAVGANGPCTVHVNFGQAGFVFIEANVKKWGLAPVTGSLAPPPPYGAEQGSILLETGSKDGFSGPSRAHFHSQSVHAFGGRSLAQDPGHSRSRSGNYRSIPPTSPGPLRSPTDISLAQLVPSDEPGESSNSGGESSGASGQVTAQTAGPSVGLGLPPDVLNRPPPEYTSPESSVVGTDNNGRRDSSESENTPLIHVLNRSRGASVATPRSNRSPPIPSYSDAVRDGAGRTRSNSARPFR